MYIYKYKLNDRKMYFLHLYLYILLTSYVVYVMRFYLKYLVV